jgi:drug/metabolite transporter (DMT)-like permease
VTGKTGETSEAANPKDESPAPEKTEAAGPPEGGETPPEEKTDAAQKTLEPSSLKRSGRLPVYLSLLLTALLWGGTFSAGKTAAREAGPLTAALLRFATAALILVPQLRILEGSFLPRKRSLRAWILLFFSALTGLVLYNYFFIRGLASTDAGRGSVIVALNPAFIYLGTVFFFGERFTLIRCVGMLTAISGTILVVTGGDLRSVVQGGARAGDIFMFLCVLSWAGYSLIGKLLVGEVSPLAANAWSTVLAVALLLPLLFFSGEDLSRIRSFSASVWTAIVFLGVGGSALGFTFFYRGILALGPNKAGVFIALVPFFGVLCGAVVFGEKITFSILAGLLVSLAGLSVIQKY